jgi:hypothetical protein
MKVVFFDRFDVEVTYKQCITHVGDRKYCAETVELLGEVVARREFVYGGKVRFRAVLPDRWQLFVAAFDRERRALVVFIGVGTSLAALYYERSGDGFRLKYVDWIVPELRATLNPHPAQFFSEL